MSKCKYISRIVGRSILIIIFILIKKPLCLEFSITAADGL